MNYLYLSLAFCIALSLTILTACKKKASDKEPVEVRQTAQIDKIYRFQSKYVAARTIRVWTPKGYTPVKNYDVLYMHDGQMLFDAATTWNHQEWGVDEAMDSLTNLGLIRPTIVVGIDNTSKRINEYCPDDIVEFLPEGKNPYGNFEMLGNNYLRFLVEELKPFIDSAYSTYPDREHTWVMGSSCGGLISSYALCKYPEVFGGAACLSTHSTLAYPDPEKPDTSVMDAYRLYLQHHLPSPNTCLLYMDNGDQTLDANYLYSQAAINEMLRSEGWDEQHFMYRFFPGAAHTEDDWKERIPIPLTFLLAK